MDKFIEEKFFLSQIQDFFNRYSLTLKTNPSGSRCYSRDGRLDGWCQVSIINIPKKEWEKASISTRNLRRDYCSLVKWILPQVGLSRMEEEFKGCWIHRGIHDYREVSDEFIERWWSGKQKVERDFEQWKKDNPPSEYYKRKTTQELESLKRACIDRMKSASGDWQLYQISEHQLKCATKELERRNEESKTTEISK